MVEIMPICRKTLFIQSINQSIDHCLINCILSSECVCIGVMSFGFFVKGEGRGKGILTKSGDVTPSATSGLQTFGVVRIS